MPISGRVPGQIRFTQDTSAPPNPNLGDEWFNTSTNKLYKFVFYNNLTQWQEIPSFTNIPLPTWSMAARPTTPTTGSMGYNTSLNAIEVYLGGWSTLATLTYQIAVYAVGAGGGGGGNDSPTGGGAAGAGAAATGTITVIPGQVFNIGVGGAGGGGASSVAGTGGGAAGTNGGAAGGAAGSSGSSGAGGGSGGWSGIYSNAPLYFIVAAGGAGGAGGGNSGTSGAGGGGGGTQVTANGTSLTGAVGNNPGGSDAGGSGAGGGGYYGGASANGGASYVNTGSVTASGTSAGGSNGGVPGSIAFTGFSGSYGTAGGAGGGNGVNGIVIVRYPGSTVRGSGGTVSQDGTYTYHYYTTPGTFTYTA